MLKKIDKAARYLAKNSPSLRCPICQSSVKLDGYALICQHGHTYNLNKKGSINFLTIKPDTTHYTRSMFEPRRQLIQAGMYAPVLAEIQNSLTSGNLLDVGSGEGSFLNLLRVEGSKFGFDIARDGINMASEYTELEAFFSLADLTNLPFADQAMGTVLNIFTPSNYREFKRVLADDGQVIKVIPDQLYLQELRTAFGMAVDYDNQEVIRKFAENFPDYTQKEVKYTFELPPQLRNAFLSMSPLEWQVSTSEKARIAQNPPQMATIHVQILQGKKS
ncbi:MAG: methyltransferase domain-containing protein [Lactococcus sp.]|uniref:rRNA (Guanine-N1-)-methyltransferase n=1 Tax=Pseudolactococcus piscium MKFS47 TaxID=297352 RepID=A0A0D6DYP2_9LACT|nr:MULTISPECIES: methyltransferase domain-containing protein [Lactococcus]MDN5403978.1 methyltransferase domain-containing protein [Lactococcus sp.]MDN5411370.1 methyltransferase domain-containing protein [Lactococcus sp.]MDN5460988.1 methyltransferase domain-containing protein [Lactococcus sp.]MDN6211529.1 methyltransferase domain-containing protein [Lactococcus sp.]MDN6524458.1 methyltransferase domain-containing protein [Lactococcus sp.]